MRKLSEIREPGFLQSEGATRVMELKYTPGDRYWRVKVLPEKAPMPGPRPKVKIVRRTKALVRLAGQKWRARKTARHSR